MLKYLCFLMLHHDEGEPRLVYFRFFNSMKISLRWGRQLTSEKS